jgi:hypothetical protein
MLRIMEAGATYGGREIEDEEVKGLGDSEWSEMLVESMIDSKELWNEVQDWKGGRLFLSALW